VGEWRENSGMHVQGHVHGQFPGRAHDEGHSPSSAGRRQQNGGGRPERTPDSGRDGGDQQHGDQQHSDQQDKDQRAATAAAEHGDPAGRSEGGGRPGRPRRGTPGRRRVSEQGLTGEERDRELRRRERERSLAWRAHAACRNTDPERLFVRGAAQRQAKSICGACPVRTECLAEALDRRVEFGVWGGMTERERRALLRRRPEVTSWWNLLTEARTRGDRCVG
jgi:WhiB family redox-sensing transcriptional regulator